MIILCVTLFIYFTGTIGLLETSKYFDVVKLKVSVEVEVSFASVCI